MIPQQQVGKKRGLFSKILGIAAPFLSFVPGVGPILSQVAGIASQALGGNWSGAVSGIAGGLSPGGVFRGSGGSSLTGGGATGGTHNIGGAINLPGFAGRRAAGGPGMGGRVYWTGEHGPEPFLAPGNGYFLNHRDAMSAMGGGGDSPMVAQLTALLDRHSAAVERQNAILSRLEGVSPNHVVRMGARGLIEAYDQDAGLVRLSSQRHRLP